MVNCHCCQTYILFLFKQNWVCFDEFSTRGSTLQNTAKFVESRHDVNKRDLNKFKHAGETRKFFSAVQKYNDIPIALDYGC